MEHEMAESAVMTYRDFEATYGVSVDTQRWWRRVGKGPKSFRLGRRVVYLRTDVELWLEAQRQNGDA